jgi:hypothetical protein
MLRIRNFLAVKWIVRLRGRHRPTACPLLNLTRDDMTSTIAPSVYARYIEGHTMIVASARRA